MQMYPQNWGDICLQEAGKLLRRKSCRNTTLRREAKTSAVPSQQKRKYTQWVSATISVQIKQDMPNLTRPKAKGGLGEVLWWTSVILIYFHLATI